MNIHTWYAALVVVVTITALKVFHRFEVLQRVRWQIWVAAFAIASLIDAGTTYWALSHYTILAEGNPVLSLAIRHLGLMPALVMHSMMLCGILWLVCALLTRRRGIWNARMHALAFGLAFARATVSITNAVQIFLVS